MNRLVASLFIVGALASGRVSASAVHLSTTLPASADNTMFSDADTLSNGAGVFLFIGENGIGNPRRSLLRFAIADSLPAGATIDSVRLALHISKAAPHAPGDLFRPSALYALTADWGEGASDAGDPGGSGTAAQIGDATWAYSFFDTATWNTPGGDFAVSASAVQMVGASGFANWASAQMTADVQGWLDFPASNFGWILQGDESQSLSARRLDSRESATTANRPALTVYYSVTATAVGGPKPPALALGANLPNPFNPATTIPFVLPFAGRTRVAIYDVRGALVRVLVDREMPAGPNRTVWDGRDARGEPVSSGVYLCRLEHPAGVRTRKLVAVK
jgi:FlgD Ig-like domain